MDLHETSLRLKVLASKKPNDEYRNEVLKALSSKHEGIGVCAAKTLSAWGDSKSVEDLRTTLNRIAKREARWAATGAISKELYPHLKEIDVPWATELILRISNRNNRFTLFGMLLRLPVQKVLEQLDREEIVGGVDPDEVQNARHLLKRNIT